MSEVVIITGMHRSATSLVASLLGAGGVQLGTRLLEPNFQNPLGFFEDRDFFEFHENALHRRGQTILVDRDFVFAPEADECRSAEQLVAARAAYPLWGWKDPRTCLFWQFWDKQLPDAKWLIVYRHPFDVLLSLMRRREAFMPGLLRGLDAWQTYNRRALEFAEHAPDRALVCHAYAVIDEVERFNALLRERLGLELKLDAATRAALYKPNALWRAQLSAELDTVMTRVHSEAMELYARLEQSAGLPAPNADSAEDSPVMRALAEFAAAASDAEEQRRGLLWALLGVREPATLEYFLQDQWRAPEEMQGVITHLEGALATKDAEFAQARALAEERERQLKEQTAWVEPRMEDLRALEANPVVRAMQRLRRTTKDR